MRRRFFLFLLLGNCRGVLITDFALNTDKVGHIAIGITQGGNKELIPKGGTIDTIIEQTNRHVIALFDGLADTFDRLGVGFGALQKATVTSQNLIQGVSRKIEETLTRVHNGIVGQTGVGNNKVLLRRLQSLDEAKVGIVQHLVGDTLRAGQQTVRRISSTVLATEQLFGLFVTEVRTNALTEFFVLFLEKSNRLLERFQQELFANTTALGVFTVAFTEN